MTMPRGPARRTASHADSGPLGPRASLIVVPVLIACHAVTPALLITEPPRQLPAVTSIEETYRP